MKFRVTGWMKHLAVDGGLLLVRRNSNATTIAPYPMFHDYGLGNCNFHGFPLLGFGSRSASCF
jgi:hypothetical protein